METPAFMPIKTYLKSVEFESPNTPNLFFNTESAASLGLSINVQSKIAEDTSLYLVELHTSLTPKINEQIVFNLKLIYSTLVEIVDKDMDDETRKHLLTVIIPRSMYDPLRALVWSITLASGFPPIMMSDYNFINQANSSVMPFDNNSDNLLFNEGIDEESLSPEGCVEISESDTETPQESISTLGYDWIIEKMELQEDGPEFLKILGGVTNNNLSVYEELPLYKFYYRFLTPIEYNHPDYEEECEGSYWPILFQLLFAEGNEVKVIEGENGLPEIEFAFSDDEERRTVSSLTLNELKSLTSELAVKAFTDTFVEIFRLMKNIDTDYADRLRDDQLILKEELHALYHTDAPNANPKDIEFIDGLYARIKECDLQTFPYKL